MHQKITDPEQLPDAENLPQLTARQYEFVRLLLEGRSASDAYRGAYGAEGYSPNSLWTKASLLASSVKVRQWLSAAHKAGYATAVWSLSRYQQELASLYALSLEKGALNVAKDCLKALGDSSGHNINRTVELERDPLQVLKEIASKNPEIAQRLAEAENLEQPQQLH